MRKGVFIILGLLLVGVFMTGMVRGEPGKPGRGEVKFSGGLMCSNPSPKTYCKPNGEEDYWGDVCGNRGNEIRANLGCGRDNQTKFFDTQCFNNSIDTCCSAGDLTKVCSGYRVECARPKQRDENGKWKYTSAICCNENQKVCSESNGNITNEWCIPKSQVCVFDKYDFSFKEDNGLKKCEKDIDKYFMRAYDCACSGSYLKNGSFKSGKFPGLCEGKYHSRSRPGGIVVSDKPKSTVQKYIDSDELGCALGKPFNKTKYGYCGTVCGMTKYTKAKECCCDDDGDGDWGDKCERESCDNPTDSMKVKFMNETVKLTLKGGNTYEYEYYNVYSGEMEKYGRIYTITAKYRTSHSRYSKENDSSISISYPNPNYDPSDRFSFSSPTISLSFHHPCGYIGSGTYTLSDAIDARYGGGMLGTPTSVTKEKISVLESPCCKGPFKMGIMIEDKKLFISENYGVSQADSEKEIWKMVLKDPRGGWECMKAKEYCGKDDTSCKSLEDDSDFVTGEVISEERKTCTSVTDYERKLEISVVGKLINYDGTGSKNISGGKGAGSSRSYLMKEPVSFKSGDESGISYPSSRKDNWDGSIDTEIKFIKKGDKIVKTKINVLIHGSLIRPRRYYSTEIDGIIEGKEYALKEITSGDKNKNSVVQITFHQDPCSVSTDCLENVEKTKEDGKEEAEISAHNAMINPVLDKLRGRLNGWIEELEEKMKDAESYKKSLQGEIETIRAEAMKAERELPNEITYLKEDLELLKLLEKEIIEEWKNLCETDGSESSVCSEKPSSSCGVGSWKRESMCYIQYGRDSLDEVFGFSEKYEEYSQTLSSLSSSLNQIKIYETAIYYFNKHTEDLEYLESKTLPDRENELSKSDGVAKKKYEDVAKNYEFIPQEIKMMKKDFDSQEECEAEKWVSAARIKIARGYIENGVPVIGDFGPAFNVENVGPFLVTAPKDDEKCFRIVDEGEIPLCICKVGDKIIKNSKLNKIGSLYDLQGIGNVVRKIGNKDPTSYAECASGPKAYLEWYPGMNIVDGGKSEGPKSLGAYASWYLKNKFPNYESKINNRRGFSIPILALFLGRIPPVIEMDYYEQFKSKDASEGRIGDVNIAFGWSRGGSESRDYMEKYKKLAKGGRTGLFRYDPTSPSGITRSKLSRMPFRVDVISGKSNPASELTSCAGKGISSDGWNICVDLSVYGFGGDHWGVSHLVVKRLMAFYIDELMKESPSSEKFVSRAGALLSSGEGSNPFDITGNIILDGGAVSEEEMLQSPNEEESKTILLSNEPIENLEGSMGQILDLSSEQGEETKEKLISHALELTESFMTGEINNEAIVDISIERFGLVGEYRVPETLGAMVKAVEVLKNE